MIISQDLFLSYFSKLFFFCVKFIYCYDNFKIDIYTEYSILIYRFEIFVNCMKKNKIK